MTFKIHPLHTAEGHCQVIKEIGIVGYHQYLEDKRRTGRSTARALQFIALAIESPHKAILLTDHGHERVGTAGAKRNFAALVSEHLRNLGLLHMQTQHRNGEYYLIFGDDSK